MVSNQPKPSWREQLPGVVYGAIGPLAAWNGQRHGWQVTALLARQNGAPERAGVTP